MSRQVSSVSRARVSKASLRPCSSTTEKNIHEQLHPGAASLCNLWLEFLHPSAVHLRELPDAAISKLLLQVGDGSSGIRILLAFSSPC